MDSKQHSHFLYKVIIRTINFEHLIWDIIKTHFGLEPFFNNEGKIENYEDIIMFEKYFLRDFGSFSKAKIIKEITKQTIEFNKEKIEFPKRFNEKFEEFMR